MVLLITVASADFVGQGHGTGRVDGDVQHKGAVASIEGGDDSRVSGVAHFRTRHIETVVTVNLTQTERCVEVCSVQLVNDEVQHGSARTSVTVNGLQLFIALFGDVGDVETVLVVVASVADVRLDGVAGFNTHGQR